MIRRKLTRIELQLDDTKELDELFSRPTITQTNLFNLSSHKAFQNTSTFEKQLQTEIINSGNNPTDTQIVQATGTSSTSTVNNNQATGSTHSEIQERIGYNPQPYNSSTRFQFNQSGIR